MVTRDEIVAEIEKVPAKHLDELYTIIRNYEEIGEAGDGTESVMAKLRQIRVSAARDFSTNADLHDLE